MARRVNAQEVVWAESMGRRACRSSRERVGADELEIMEVMGHTDPTTVKRQYGHLFTPKPKQRGAEMSEELERQAQEHRASLQE